MGLLVYLTSLVMRIFLAASYPASSISKLAFYVDGVIIMPYLSDFLLLLGSGSALASRGCGLSLASRTSGRCPTGSRPAKQLTEIDLTINLKHERTIFLPPHSCCTALSSSSLVLGGHEGKSILAVPKNWLTSALEHGPLGVEVNEADAHGAVGVLVEAHEEGLELELVEFEAGLGECLDLVLLVVGELGVEVVELSAQLAGEGGLTPGCA